MARVKKEVTAQERGALVVPLDEAQKRVQLQLDRGKCVPNESINENHQARRWYDFTSELLRQLCTNDELQDEFTGKGSYDWGNDLSTGGYLKKLESIYDRLELIPAQTVLALSGEHAAIRAFGAGTNSGGKQRVFVVHGHDHGAKEAVARFIVKLDLVPVVLHEQPNRGQTVIEKFEAHSDVGFAVVLFTADDIGYPAGKEGDAKPRARQNVVLELGFFMAKLGRERVCVLYRSGVEIPSDYTGVLYHQMDDPGAWQLALAREIKAAGIDVDINKVL